MNILKRPSYSGINYDTILYLLLNSHLNKIMFEDIKVRTI